MSIKAELILSKRQARQLRELFESVKSSDEKSAIMGQIAENDDGTVSLRVYFLPNKIAKKVRKITFGEK